MEINIFEKRFAKHIRIRTKWVYEAVSLKIAIKSCVNENRRTPCRKTLGIFRLIKNVCRFSQSGFLYYQRHSLTLHINPIESLLMKSNKVKVCSYFNSIYPPFSALLTNELDFYCTLLLLCMRFKFSS